MDIVLLVITVGCGIAGMIWGAVRMATLAAALVAATFAGRWAGPPLAHLLQAQAGMKHGAHVAGVAFAAVVALLLVFVAGRGLRKVLAELHLGCIDRVAGAVFAAFAAAFVMAVLLGLAAQGGWVPPSPIAKELSAAGRAVLATQSWASSSATPSSTPPSATRSGQQPR